MTVEYDNMYVPSPPPMSIDPVVSEWVSRELRRIHDTTIDKVGMHGQDGAWFDNLTALTSGKVGAANAPTWAAFGPTGTNFAWAFDINDYIQTAGFHINHDVKRGSLIYPHVHWTTDGTDTNPVKWEMSYTIAKGHNQAAFPADTVITVEQAASGTAWQHMIAEVGESTGAFEAPEVDSLVILRLRRITNGATDNTDDVFGLFVDLHYQIERTGTMNKAPNFYER